MPDSNQKIEKIIIIGGGSSGWISAAYLNKKLNANVDITVIASPDIGRIGVGEATIPSIKTELFDTLGLSEADWMPHCQATYKMGIRYANWKYSPAQGGDHYYHNFGEIPDVNDIPLTHIWLKKHLENTAKKPMDYACIASTLACDYNKSPNLMNGTPVQHYAYHFDALALSNLLRERVLKRGVKHLTSHLVDSESDEQGNITCVIDTEGNKYDADLFIDCSGFTGFLIDKMLKEPIISYADSLLTDRAISIHIEEDSERDGIRPYTTATAMNAGWMWEIPLFARSGNGYVYSSQFINEEEAEREARAFFKGREMTTKHIRFESRRRRRSWVKNVVSIGLASSFLEPLESTGLYFVYAALFQLVEYFPNKAIDPVLRDAFNERVSFMVEDTKDFIVMHFKTAMREDTPFWKANKYETAMPESLKMLLDQHKAGLPVRKSLQSNKELYASFAAQFNNFWTNSNYQSILCGVDYRPTASLPILEHRPDVMAKGEAILKEIAAQSARLAESMPTQYDYLKQLYQQQKKRTEKEPIN